MMEESQLSFPVSVTRVSHRSRVAPAMLCVVSIGIEKIVHVTIFA